MSLSLWRHFSPLPMNMIKERFRRPQSSEPGSRIRLVFEDFHRLKMKGTYEYPRHRHVNYEVILVECGPYWCELNGEQLRLGRGQVLVIKPGDWHQDHLRAGQRHFVLHFRVVESVQGDQAVPVFQNEVSPSDQICRGTHGREAFVFRELKREAEAGAIHAQAVQDSLLEAFFWRIIRGLPKTVLSAPFRRLSQVEVEREKLGALFQRNLQSNPTVQKLAAEAAMSPRHLTTRCVHVFGEGPARFLLGLKIRKADELLRYQDYSVKEASDALGFANPYHFSRAFKRVLGQPPSHRRHEQD